MHALALALAVLFPLPFDLCCTELVDGELACHDLMIDKDPECAWITSCAPTVFGVRCSRSEPIQAHEIEDWRCCAEAPDLDEKLTFTGCVEAEPVLSVIPWCSDETLSMSVTCADPWVLDLESGLWVCLG